MDVYVWLGVYADIAVDVRVCGVHWRSSYARVGVCGVLALHNDMYIRNTACVLDSQHLHIDPSPRIKCIPVVPCPQLRCLSSNTHSCNSTPCPFISRRLYSALHARNSVEAVAFRRNRNCDYQTLQP